MSRRAAACALLAAALGGAQAAEEAGRGLKLSGYYKNLLARSETVLAGRERYTVDLNRLRLELRGKPAENVALDLQYDNEILLGSYLRTGQFALQKDQPPDQYWNAEANYAEAGSYYGRHRLYRASVTLSAGETDVRLGRQRIAWGTGRFWSALDLLNPFSPIALEREERVGVDAALVEHRFGPLSRLSAVYAPRHEREDSTRALNWHANAAGIDYSLVAGRFRREDVVGADIATQIGTTGVRAELTRNARETMPAYWRAVFALDHAFANTLTLSGELYYNGAGAADRAAYDFASLLAGRIQNVGRRYAGAFLSYEITPLIKWSNFLVVNLADRSRFYSPGLAFSLRANLDLTLGVQLFGGSQGSEYQRFNDLYYAQLQWFY
jgi:hypothetical protein